jgi:hypothetical protein
MAKAHEGFPHGTNNFFGFYRFDFMVDENLEPFLTEVNMGPSVTTRDVVPSETARLYYVGYERLVYSILGAAGLYAGAYAHPHTTPADLDVRAHLDELYVEMPGCDTCRAADSCVQEACAHCVWCWDAATKEVVRKAVGEHRDRGALMRLYPPPADLSAMFGDVAAEELPIPAGLDQLMHIWYDAKCRGDPRWCS